MSKKEIYKKIIPLLILVLTISSCSTKKKTYVHRKYHDITAKYNGYFNGKESLKYGIKKLENAQVDDFSKILSIYKHDEISLSKSHLPYMEKSIKKGSVVIQNHSINIKNKEYCKWIDDSYFLVAKAYYFKGEFIESKKTFDFIKNKYKKTEIAFESTLWVAKCYIALNDFHSAETILDDLQSKKRFPEKLRKELHLTLSDLYLHQEMYIDAIDELKSTCNLIKRKRKKARYYYIIAQIYQNKSNIKQSKKYFELVLDANPEYEMVFNAKMNLARTLRNKKDLNQMRDKLVKMINDEKNKDYLDQIYYTLGEMSVIEKDTVSAIENFTLSTKYSFDNDIQKSVSFLQLGKIHYNKSKYISSKTYYDSTIFFMPENHRYFEESSKTQKILEELVFHLNTINYEDSLQWAASLSETERKILIQAEIAKVIKKEQEELRAQQNNSFRGTDGRNGRNESFGNNTSGGKWYFYNPATLSFGMSEFRKKWGKRKLEDDWRRSNKKSTTTLEEDSITTEKNKEQNNLKSEKYYIDQLPLTKESIDISNAKIINSYYEASVIYKDELEEIRKSEQMLEELVKKFPNHPELTPLSLYLIYNLQTNNRSYKKAKTTKNKLISGFPESNYTKTLLDSNFIKSILNKRNKKEQEYNEVYKLYENDSFLLVSSKSSEIMKSIKNENDSIYLEKYFLLKTLSDFKINNDTSIFIKNLKTGKEKFKNSETSERCDELLNLLNSKEEIEERNKTAVLKTPYRFKKNTPHCLLIILPKENTDITFIKTLISDFNNRNYSSRIFEINAMMIGVESHLLLIKTFDNFNSSDLYSKQISSDKTIKKELNKSTHKNILISESNFSEFYKNKDFEGYSNFFNNNYLETK